MDLQAFVDKTIKKAREKRMEDSDQLTLGELIEKFEPIVAKQKDRKYEATVKYDFEYLFPQSIDSWRGSYAELALDFTGYYNGKQPMTVSAFYNMLKEAVGKEFIGYKGGEFIMDESTPVWVANYGNSGNTAVVNILDEDYQVVIITGYRDF